MKRSAILSALLVLAAAGPAFAQNLTERLLLVPPAGWHEGGTSSGAKTLTTHLFPAGQNSEKWDQMLSIQVVTEPGADPREHIQRIIDAARDGCEAYGPSPVTEAMLNNYPVSTVTVTCTKGRQTGLGGLLAVKTIKGAQAVYVVQRMWRGPAFERNGPAPVSTEMLKEWSEFLRGVGVCDTADPQRHPCPK